jgi:hypothetical protein
MSDWETLGAVDPRDLLDTRLQLHWAAQAAAAVGKQLLPHQPDFSEQSLEWLAGSRVFAQGVVAGARPFRSAIRLGSPTLLLLGGSGETLRELPLEGRTLDEAFDWVKREVEALLGRPLEKPLERPEGLPAHPVSTGLRFSFAGSAAAELERYYADSDRLLRVLRERNHGASPVVCWPHHFDIATLIRLDDPGTEAETARSIGVGLSPGDEGNPAPYFYVLPWPHPTGDLPELDSGRWHTGDWVGAVLDATDFINAGSKQRERIERFLNSAVAACRGLLGGRS